MLRNVKPRGAGTAGRQGRTGTGTHTPAPPTRRRPRPRSVTALIAAIFKRAELTPPATRYEFHSRVSLPQWPSTPAALLSLCATWELCIATDRPQGHVNYLPVGPVTLLVSSAPVAPTTIFVFRCHLDDSIVHNLVINFETGARQPGHDDGLLYATHNIEPWYR